MKNLFKFTAAAVALFAFASCSDDISEFSNSADFTAANELKIEAEEMDGGNLASSTRTAYVGTTNARVWQETDEFKVFGPQVIGMYDYYKFSKASNKFLINGTKDLETAAFVGFPKDRVDGQKWDKETKSASLEFYIPSKFDKYGEVDGSNPAAFVSNLPLWGTAENDGDGIKAKVYFLTAIIKVGLSNLKGNANMVRIIAFKDVAGTTTPAPINGKSWVQLSENGEAFNAADVQLPTPTPQFGEDFGPNEVCMPIDYDDVKAQKSVIYLPLIAGTYGNVKVQYSNDGGTNWTTINEYKNKEFKRATCYGKGNECTFNVSADNVWGLNDQLEGMKTASGEVVVTCDKDIKVNTTVEGNEIIIPAMPSVTKLTLKFGTNKSFKATTSALTIKGDFAGTFVLASDAVAHAVDENGKVTGLDIQLPNATVVLGQKFTDNVYTFTYAKAVQFGGVFQDAEGNYQAVDFSTGATTIKADVGDITIFDGAKVGALTLEADHLSTKIDIKAKATAGNITVPYSDPSCAPTTAITVAGKAGNIIVNNVDATKVNNATIEISGVAGAITNNGTGTITINGAPYFDITNDKYAKVEGNVTTGGDVTIALTDEGAAINGDLTMTVEKTLTLNQGYVKNIKSNVTTSDKKVTVALGSDTNYKTLVIDATNNLVAVTGTPKWNGKAFGGSLTAETKDATGTAIAAAGVTEVAGAWAAYADKATAVYTPMGLVANKATFTLAADIDLNKGAWIPAVTTGAIAGAGHTIKNLTVKVPAAGDANTAYNAGLGLFSDLKHAVSSLTLDGVTIAAAKYKAADSKEYVVSNIGALAGKASPAAAITIQNVTIKNIALSSTDGVGTTSEAANIGGVIGSTSTSKVTLAGVTVSGTNTIAGYHSLGGMIGNAGAAVDILYLAKGAIDPTEGKEVPAADIIPAATVSFKANYNSKTATVTNDQKYLKVGNMIGTAGNVVIAIGANADGQKVTVNPTLTYDKSTYTGTSYYQYVDANSNTVSVNIVSDVQSLIGFSGYAAGPATPFTTAPTINGLSFDVYGTKAAADLAPGKNYAYYFYTDAE